MMDDKNISYFAYESALFHANKANKRMFVICIILAVALIFSNLGWIIYERQFETVEETTKEYVEVEQDSKDGNNSYIGRDNNNYIGRDGEINNGTTEDQD
jgi:hypothetical protein